jgi:hypothetical protein
VCLFVCVFVCVCACVCVCVCACSRECLCAQAGTQTRVCTRCSWAECTHATEHSRAQPCVGQRWRTIFGPAIHFPKERCSRVHGHKGSTTRGAVMQGVGLASTRLGFLAQSDLGQLGSTRDFAGPGLCGPSTMWQPAAPHPGHGLVDWVVSSPFVYTEADVTDVCKRCRNTVDVARSVHHPVRLSANDGVADVRVECIPRPPACAQRRVQTLHGGRWWTGHVHCSQCSAYDCTCE